MSSNGNGKEDPITMTAERLRERFPPDDLYELVLHIAATLEIQGNELLSLRERVAHVERDCPHVTQPPCGM